MQKWEGFGWCLGSITSVNQDGRRKIDNQVINFFVSYEVDKEGEPPVPHVLSESRYATENDAPYDSWLLLEKIDDISEAGGQETGDAGEDADVSMGEAEH